MDLHTFNRQFVEDFISLYRSLPCLWNTKCKEYKDRHKKSKAYEKLVALQKQVNPSATRDTVVKRINSLRSSYRKEKKRVKSKSEIRGEIVQPGLWYFHLLKFVDGCDSDFNRTDDFDNDESEIHVEYLEEYKPKDSVNKRIKSEVDVLSVLTTQESHASGGHYPGPYREGEGGRYLHYGRHIAQQLDRLPEEMAVFCQKLINDAMFEAQMGTLSSKSKVIANFMSHEIDTL